MNEDLMISKFLYPNGGSETYIFKLSEYKDLTDAYSRNCRIISFDTVAEYTEKLMRIYRG